MQADVLQEGPARDQTVLWLLGSLCNLYRVPFDPKLIEQDFPPPHERHTFHEAARSLGFKTGLHACPDNWQSLPLPAIAYLQRKTEQSGSGSTSIPVLILKTDGSKLLFSAQDPKPLKPSR